MNIGVFDSGLGGLTILRAMMRRLPQYSYVYLGDTQRVPYGNRSQETIYQYTREAVEYLFKQDCQLVILACNTASTQALRRIQREYLPTHYPDRRVLGVIIPTVEEATSMGAKRIGLLATAATVESNAFVRECRKLHPTATVVQQAAPLLVPLIEQGAIRFSAPILRSYLRPFLRRNIDTLILGCTHYPHLRRHIRTIIGKWIRIVGQDQIIPKKLESYLGRHPEIVKTLSRKPRVRLCVTELTPAMERLSKKWFGKGKLTRVDL